MTLRLLPVRPLDVVCCVVLGAAMGVAPARSQTGPLVIDPATARAHLLNRVEPVYPLMARITQVQGDVLLRLAVSATGRVAGVQTVSGPLLLVPAARDAARQWEYKPFVVGHSPVWATVPVTVAFAIPAVSEAEDAAIAKVFFPLAAKCTQLVTQHADPNEAVSVCGEAAGAADRFSPFARYVERRSAYVYDATALIRAQQFKEAELAGEKAVAVVLLGHDDGSGASAAYGVAGQARAFDGSLTIANQYLEAAETFERKALGTPAGQELKGSYSKVLKALLTFHAEVLTALKKPEAAQKKKDEAAKL